MATFRSASVLEPVGNQNPSTTPQVIAAPAGLAVGDLLVVAVGHAQALAASNTIATPAGMTRMTAQGVSPMRMGAVFAAVVTNPATFTGGISVGGNASSTRVSIIAAAFSPAAGTTWDLGQVNAGGPEWNASAATSDTFIAGLSGTLLLNFTMTNKSASTTLTTHTPSGGGTAIASARALSAASGSVSDSVLSLIQGGTGVAFNISQANALVFGLAASEVSAGTPPNITTTVLNAMTQGTSFSQAIAASGDSPITWSVSAGSLPAGLTLNASTGVISGTPSASGAYSFSLTATNGTGADSQAYSGTVGSSSLPEVTGHGFRSVTQMMATPGATFAHRNLGLTYPEMTEYGVRMAANLGFGVIEISCQRTSDGVWIGLHDQNLNRTSPGGAYGTTAVNTLTWAQVQTQTVNVGTSGAPRPYATLQQLVETLPSDFVFMLDPKQSGGTPSLMTEFLNLVDTLLGPTRAFIKIDGAATPARLIAAKDRGYTTCAYYYAAPATPTSGTAVANNIAYVDIPGLNYDATQDGWDSFLNYGKPMWGHVCPDQAAVDTAMAKGATFTQVTSATVEPVGVNDWMPKIAAFTLISRAGGTATIVAPDVPPSELTATTTIERNGSAVISAPADPPTQLTATTTIQRTGSATIEAPAIPPSELAAFTNIERGGYAVIARPVIPPSELTATTTLQRGGTAVVADPGIAPTELTATGGIQRGGSAVITSPSISPSLLTATVGIRRDGFAVISTPGVPPTQLTATTTIERGGVATLVRPPLAPSYLTASTEIRRSGSATIVNYDNVDLILRVIRGPYRKGSPLDSLENGP